VFFNHSYFFSEQISDKALQRYTYYSEYQTLTKTPVFQVVSQAIKAPPNYTIKQTSAGLEMF